MSRSNSSIYAIGLLVAVGGLAAGVGLMAALGELFDWLGTMFDPGTLLAGFMLFVIALIIAGPIGIIFTSWWDKRNVK